MKAVVREIYGSTRVLSVLDRSKEEVRDNEILVRVYATTVNRTDCAMLTGKPFIFRFVIGLRKPKRVVLGTDFAGCIEAVGRDVTEFSVGDRVWGLHDEGLSSQAEYVLIQENEAILKIPESCGFKETVACAEGGHYANNFVNKINLKPGSKVLINGATGSIGIALLQILKYHKAEVTAVGNTKNLQLLKSLGADKVIDYTQDDFLDTQDRFNFILDAVGKSSYFKCKPLLLDGGVYLSSELGAYAQNVYLPLLTKFFGKTKVVFPLPSDIKESLLFIRDLFEKGSYRAIIDREYSLSEARQAYEYVLRGEKTGNVVLNIQR